MFGRGFREMKLAAEHEEANLHLLCEVRAVTQHRRGEPSAYVSVGGRLRDLEPRTGETAEAYRARVEPLAKDGGLLETARMQFQSFVGRLEAALHAALPEATVEEKRADAVVVRPTTQPTAPAEDPRSVVYDPYALYYPSPMSTVLDVMLISSFMHMMAPPPMIMVVHPSGVPIGGADTIASHPEAVEASAVDPGDVGSAADSGTAATAAATRTRWPTTRTSLTTAAGLRRRRRGFRRRRLRRRRLRRRRRPTVIRDRRAAAARSARRTSGCARSLSAFRVPLCAVWPAGGDGVGGGGAGRLVELPVADQAGARRPPRGLL